MFTCEEGINKILAKMAGPSNALDAILGDEVSDAEFVGFEANDIIENNENVLLEIVIPT